MKYIIKQKIFAIHEYTRTHPKCMFAFLLIVTFVLRTIYTYLVFSKYGTTKWADDFEYLWFGRQFAQLNFNTVSDIWGHIQVGPALPALIALFLIVLKSAIWPVFLYNIVITTLLVPLLFKIGNLTFNRKIGLALACWGMLYPDYFKYNPHILKEPTVFFFLPLSVISAFYGQKSRKLFFSVASALSFSWLIHADERYLIYVPFFWLLFLFGTDSRLKCQYKKCILFTLVIIATMSPWLLRNYFYFHEVVILSRRTTAVTSRFWGTDHSRLSFEDSGAGNTSVKNRLKSALKYKEIYGIQPRKYTKTEAYLRAFINYWQPTYFRPTFIQSGYRFQKWSLFHNISGLLGYGIFLPFFVIGICYAVSMKNVYAVFLFLIPVTHSVIHTIMIWPLERYRSPVVFCVVCIGMYGFEQVYHKIRMKNK